MLWLCSCSMFVGTAQVDPAEEYTRELAEWENEARNYERLVANAEAARAAASLAEPSAEPKPEAEAGPVLTADGAKEIAQAGGEDEKAAPVEPTDDVASKIKADPSALVENSQAGEPSQEPAAIPETPQDVRASAAE